uniref:Major facilitator superfamily (MFS) profile domain-containing protein n=1 Tax=Ditylenchus dipsaci TaxID=166011 RepID=A0A915DW15_9BILA
MSENGILYGRTRFLLLVLVVLCLAINWANILTFNFTVICMQPKGNASLLPLLISNSSAEPISAVRTAEFTNTEKSQAMAVVAAGALIANIPIVTLINCLIPSAMNMGFYWFLGARVLQGIAFAGDMATFGHFVTYWTYHKQYAFFTATLCVYVQLAPVFTNPVSGLLCDSSWGWPGVYYFHAVISVVLFTAFFFFYRNDPNTHPYVNELEKNKIARGRDTMDAMAQRSVPYKEILCSSAAWAVFIGAIGNFAGINLLFQFTPTYLNKVQGFQVMKTGFLAALPPLLQAVMKELSGLSNDRIPISFMSETVKTKVYNSIAFLSMVFFLIVLTFIPPGSGATALVIIVAGATLLGFNTGGFYKSGSLIAGPYAPFVLGQVSTAMTITMLVVPLIVNPLTPNNTQQEWGMAFYTIAAIMVACNIYYVIYAKGEPCYWSTSKYYRQRMDKLAASKATTNKIHCIEADESTPKIGFADGQHKYFASVAG